MSFDSFPIIYWLIGFFICGMLVLMANIEKIGLIFTLLIGGLLLLVMRLPVVVFNHELNPDESQIISQALTLRQNPIFWQSVDGTTIGPLDIYLLTLVKFFGGNIDYSTAHAAALGCSLVSLLFFSLSIRNFFNESTAKLAVIPVILFLAFTQETDFIHYTSEQVPLVLLTSSLWLSSSIYKGNTSKWFVFLLGFILGMIPFAKLQASLQAVYLGMGIFLVLLQRRQIKSTFTLILGGLTFPILVFIFLISFGLLPSFVEFYIKGNLVYASSGNTKSIFSQFVDILVLSPNFLKYLSSLAGLILIGAFSVRKNVDRWLLGFLFGWVLVSIYAITKSGNPFVHYLNLLIYPLALLGAFFVHYVKKPNLKIVIAFIPFLVWLISFIPQALKKQPLNLYVSTTNHTLQQSEVAKKILEYAHKGDMLVVWGWACRYYVETQLTEGTAETHAVRCIYEHPMRANYRKRYIADIRQNRPAVFVDAVGKNSVWVQDTTTQSHQNFPELRDFIALNYTLKATVDEVKIYVLNERSIRK